MIVSFGMNNYTIHENDKKTSFFDDILVFIIRASYEICNRVTFFQLKV